MTRALATQGSKEVHVKPIRRSSDGRRGRPHLRLLPALATATMLLASLVLGSAAPALAAPARAAAPNPGSMAQLSDYGEPFHFLAPLGVESGDPTKFDASLLNELVISICRVEASGCTLVKTLTSTSALSERLRLGPTNGTPTYYLANWDTSTVKLAPSTFRVTVTVDRLVLGSVDVGPATYKSFGRTWPIKFRIENNPRIRVRVLREAGKGASQIGNAIRTEFGLCGDDLAQLLANDLDPFTQQDITVAVDGVCQAAVIPTTTKVADAATGSALTAFDPTTGQMTFSSSTNVLAALKVGDVLVGEPATAAPDGYLRKVTSITKAKKTGVITLGTTQALLDEAITDGTLDATGDLHPEDVIATQTLPGVTLLPSKSANSLAGISPNDVGDGFDFHESINVDLDSAVGGDGVSGTGHVHIDGYVNFNAGYNVGFGIESCLRLPFFTCVDRVEAHLGAHLDSKLHITGTFDGELHKETVLSEHFFQPIVFFIGPIPVVLIPVLKAVAGVDGSAHAVFSFTSTVTGNVDAGAKWTDPGDGGSGWGVTPPNPSFTGTADADVQASMDLHAYAGADAELLLYGLGGPGLEANAGIEGIAKVPGTPVWDIWGEANGKVTFGFDLGGVLSLGGYEHDIPGYRFHIRAADNEAPVCWGQTGLIPIPVDTYVVLGPHTFANNWQGFFDCPDPEGGPVTYTAKEGSTDIDYSNYKWTTTGEHDVVITATDDHGNASQVTLKFDVEDSPPILSTVEASGSVRAGVQYFVTATAWDAEAGGSGDWLRCDALHWEATYATIRFPSGGHICTAEVIFSQNGAQTITVTATEPKPNGKSSTHVVNVTVFDAPANPAPVLRSFSVTADSGPISFCDDPTAQCTDACETGFNCPVPPDSILFNGMTGDYHEPLTLSVSASDPNGDPLTVQWFCLGNGFSYVVTDNHDGTFSCSPFSADPQQPILIWASVSDGTTVVHSEVRRLFMYSRLAVN